MLNPSRRRIRPLATSTFPFLPIRNVGAPPLGDDGDDVNVYVGTTTNAAPLARHLPDEPTYLVSAGTAGERAVGDDVGALLVDHYLDGSPPAVDELASYCDVLEVARRSGATSTAGPSRLPSIRL